MSNAVRRKVGWGKLFMVRLSITRKGFAAAVLVALSSATLASASAPSHKPSYWHPWFEIGGYHNSRDDDSSDSTGTSGTNRGETTIFAPISGSERSLVFGQMTAKFFEDSAKEGNLALGYRKMTTFGFNLGAWIGGDVRRTEIDNTFWQLSGGFEALSKNVDLRLNWYGPVTKPQTGVAGFAQLHLQGSQIYMTGGEEVGMKGVDGEIGFRLPTEYLKLNPKVFELRAYAGGYHFENDEALEDITGVNGRLEFRINDVIASLPGSRLTVDYEVSHDDVRDTRHDVGMRLRIPLNGGKSAQSLASLSHQQRRMLDGVERDTDIVTARSKAEFVADALTGTNFDRVAYASGTSVVTDTSNAAGDNSLIILNGEVQGAQSLQGNQTLQGGGSTIQVRGRKSGLVVPFTAPGDAGRLTSPVGVNDNLTLQGSNTHVAGITIVGNGGVAGTMFGEFLSNDGVDILDRNKNIFLTDLNISQTFSAIRIVGDGNQVAVNGGLLWSNELGVVVSGDNNLLSMSGVTLDDIGPAGVVLSGDNNELIVSNSTFGAGGRAIYFFVAANAKLHASGTDFYGPIGVSLFQFDNSTVTLQVGSSGNTNASGAITCQTFFSNSVSGEITFADGTTAVNSANCGP